MKKGSFRLSLSLVAIFIWQSLFAQTVLADSFQDIPPITTSSSLTTMCWVGDWWFGPLPGGEDYAQVFGTSGASVGPLNWYPSNNSGTGYATSSVGYGNASLYSSVSRAGASTRGDADSYTFAAYAYSRFSDTMTLSNPLLNGQPGSITFDFTLSGTSSSSGSGWNVAMLWVCNGTRCSSTGSNYILKKTREDFNGTESWTTGPINFTYGTPFSFYVAIGAESGLYGDEEGSASINLLNTFILDGLDVYNENNIPVTDYAMRTESGARYPYVGVPEPATIFMLLISFIGLAGVRRRFTKQN
jgi:hypothetical protein